MHSRAFCKTTLAALFHAVDADIDDMSARVGGGPFLALCLSCLSDVFQNRIIG